MRRWNNMRAGALKGGQGANNAFCLSCARVWDTTSRACEWAAAKAGAGPTECNNGWVAVVCLDMRCACNTEAGGLNLGATRGRPDITRPTKREKAQLTLTRLCLPTTRLVFHSCASLPPRSTRTQRGVTCGQGRGGRGIQPRDSRTQGRGRCWGTAQRLGVSDSLPLRQHTVGI